MTVEISDEKFKLLPDYSGAKAGKSGQQSGLDCAIDWLGGDLSALAGQTVRLKINITKDSKSDPRLFAVYLRAD